MTTHKIIAKLQKQVNTIEEGRAMWARIYKAWAAGKLGTSQATDLGMYLERRFGKPVLNF